MSITSVLKSYVDAVWQYIITHKHAFLISLGVSIVVTILTNIITHYLGDVLRLLHVPTHFIQMITNS